MIYLIKDRDYLKIGYSANIDQRKKAYETTNCYAEILMIKEGSRKDETILHKLCEEWHYKNEWFFYNEKIIKIFENYQINQDQKIANLEKTISDLTTRLNKLENIVNGLLCTDKELSTLNDLCKTLLF